MRKFTVERQYLMPVYQHIAVEAETAVEAMRDAMNQEKHAWTGSKDDPEGCRPHYITAAWEGEEAYRGNRTTDFPIPADLSGPPDHLDRDAFMAALQPLIAYAAAAPAIACGEGFWDDQDSACGDGMRQEKSEAAAIIRDALKALGIEPPPGIAVCPECFEPAGEHSSQCSRDGDDIGDGDLFTVTLRAASIQVTATGESQATRYAESDAREFIRQHTYSVDDVGPAGDYETPSDLDDVDIAVELVERGPARGEGLWTFDAVIAVNVRAEDEDGAEAAALKLVSGEDRSDG